MCSQISLCCIDHDQDIHSHVSSVLGDTSPYELKLSLRDLSELTSARPNSAIDIVLLEVGGRQDLSGHDIERVKTCFHDAAIVLLVDRVSPDIIANALSAGVAGCLGRRHDIDALAIYLDLVLRGVRVLPSMLGDIMMRYRSWFDGLVYPPPDCNLSAREREILAHLATGNTNKVIARELGIVEATVKVHLRTILRKLGVENRTQAAIKAIQLGLLDDTGSDGATSPQ